MVAVDIGSSPGGWSSYLAHHGCEKVISIDPADLLIQPHPSIIHVKKRIEDAKSALDEYGPFDIVVCDMNIYSSRAASILLDLSFNHLKPGCLLIFTIKELESGQSKKLVSAATELLSCAFQDIRVRFLLSNGRERTMIAKRKLDIDINQHLILKAKFEADQQADKREKEGKEKREKKLLVEQTRSDKFSRLFNNSIPMTGTDLLLLTRGERKQLKRSRKKEEKESKMKEAWASNQIKGNFPPRYFEGKEDPVQNRDKDRDREIELENKEAYKMEMKRQNEILMINEDHASFTKLFEECPVKD